MSIGVKLLTNYNVSLTVRETLGAAENKSAKGARDKIRRENTAGAKKELPQITKQTSSGKSNAVEVPDYRTVLPKLQIHAQNIANIRAQTLLKSALVKQYGDYVDTSSVQKAISVKIDSSFNVDVECNEKLIDFNSEKIASDTQSFNQNADDVFISYSEISEDDSLKNWMSQQYKKIEYEDLIETNNIELKMSKKRGDIFSSYNKTMGQGGFLDKSELIRRLMNNMESELEKEILQDIGEKLQKDYGVALPALKNTKYKP